MATDTKKESPNGVAEEAKPQTLEAQEGAWVSALLSNPQVCALLGDPFDKEIAARIQAKLNGSGPE